METIAPATQKKVYQEPPYAFGCKALANRVDTLYDQENERKARKVAISRTSRQECERILALGDQACKDILNQLPIRGDYYYWADVILGILYGVLAADMIFLFFQLTAHLDQAEASVFMMAALKTWWVIALWTVLCSLPTMWHFAGKFWRYYETTRVIVTVLMSFVPLVLGIILHTCNKQAGLGAMWVIPAFFSCHVGVLAFHIRFPLE